MIWYGQVSTCKQTMITMIKQTMINKQTMICLHWVGELTGSTFSRVGDSDR